MNLITPVILMNIILFIITVLLIFAESVLVPHKICKVVINKERVFTTESGASLLSFFTKNKIFIPSACGGKATCGHCKIKVLNGGGPILPTEEVFITQKEKSAGIRLACQVKIKQDIEVYLPEHLFEAKEYQAVVEEISSLTHDIKHFTLKLLEPKTINFKPGQYIQIKVPGTEEFRAYSIASSPRQNDRIELIIRLVHGGLCSTYMHNVLEVGDKVVFTGPFGEFFLREESDKEIICIAGGCGMSPIRSIILYLAELGMPRKVTYFFGARTKKDLFYVEEMTELEKKYPNFKFIPALSEPEPEDKWEGEVGLITQVVERYLDIYMNGRYEIYLSGRYEGAGVLESYLCGPPPMIDAAIKVLTKKGVHIENVYYDKF